MLSPYGHKDDKNPEELYKVFQDSIRKVTSCSAQSQKVDLLARALELGVETLYQQNQQILKALGERDKAK